MNVRLLRVQKYHLYSLLQAFLNLFFDLFLTLALTRWKREFWKYFIFLSPTLSEGDGAEMDKKQGCHYIYVVKI